MELTYRTEGDYRLPNLEAPEAPKVGKYGMLRRSYLQTHRNAYYTGMLLSGRLRSIWRRSTGRPPRWWSN